MAFQEGLVGEAPQLKPAATQCGTVAMEYVTVKYVEGSLDISMVTQMLFTEAPLTVIVTRYTFCGWGGCNTRIPTHPYLDVCCWL